MILTGTHDRTLVALSIFIAVFASYTALSVAQRIRASSGWARNIWILAATIALGGGIWSMHFVAMLAFSVPGMSMRYDLALTIFSLALALIFTGAGLRVMSDAERSVPRVVVAGLLIGCGVLVMHYVGMAAMHMDATMGYDRAWVAASIFIAIGAATAAVWLASLDHEVSHRIAAASLMGVAIAGMHYAGMRAAIFHAGHHGSMGPDGASFSQTYLAGAVSTITILILLVALGAARLDEAFRTYARRQARIALRLRIADALREYDSGKALGTVAALMGEHFGVARTGLGQFDAALERFHFDVCWTDGSVPELIGRVSASQLDPSVIAELKAGRTVALRGGRGGAAADREHAHAQVLAPANRSLLMVPLVRSGTLQTVVYLNARVPRDWRADDIQFLEELAERTRLVIEREAVEERLRELNASLEARVEARTAELLAAEEARLAADRLHRAFFENTAEALCVIAVGADGCLTAEQINPAYATHVDLPRDEIVGKTIDHILLADAAERTCRAYRHVVATGEIFRYRDAFEMPGGRQHWDTCLVPLWEGGRVTRVLGSSRDVTQQVLAEETLRQAQKLEAIGSLTGGVAHDFNNLLTPILGALDVLQRNGLGTEREQRLIVGAISSAERAKTLVHRLLAFARRQPLTVVPVNVPELIEGMAELVGSTVGPKIRFETQIIGSLPAALADANQLEMALLNLCVNARDAMAEGGSLHVHAAVEHVDTGDHAGLRPGSYVRITVADTGTGMDEQTLKRAIEPFFSTKGVGKGTGLGLSMAHGLAAQLGGMLTIESELGVGTKVSLWLPPSLERHANKAVAARVPTAPMVSDGHALLVDDEALAREATAAMLRDLGYSVTQASCAEDALRLLEEGLAPDLVVTDHLMPGMNGADLVAHIRQADSCPLALVISGYADADTIPAQLPLLTKPFKLDELARKLVALSAPEAGFDAGGGGIAA